MKDNIKNKDFCWLILKASLGEFHVIVPELVNFCEEENLKLHITFLTTKIEKQFYHNLLYKKLAEHYFEVVERKDIISFSLQNKKKLKYLFRDVSTLDQYSVTRSLKILLPNTKLIMFPHAFAFYVSESFSNFQSLKIPLRNKFEECVDAFITFTEADKKYFSERFPSDIITVFTPRGLSEDWLYKLQEIIPHEEIKAFQDKYPKRVLLTIRHPHKVYLSEKNYFDLLKEVTEVSNNYGYSLFLKPHPRQDMDAFLNYCESNQLHVWTKDTYTSALFFDFVITFWSSASIDFSAFAIPTIEHFRYEKYHNQLIQKDKKLSSLYVNMGLSLPSTNKAELEIVLKKIIEDPQGIGRSQQKNLKETYYSPRLNLQTMRFGKPKKFSFLNKLLHYVRLHYYIIKNK